MADAFIEPVAEQLALLTGLGDDKPIQMLNLLKFREHAEYPDGHPHAGEGWSGQRAYQQYGQEIAASFAGVGAKVVWQNASMGTVIGPVGEAWDMLLVAEYPSAKAFLTMVSDPEYQKGKINRTAALADSRLVMSRPLSA